MSPWSSKNERIVEDAFAPLRRGNRVRVCIDGEMYFKHMCDEIKDAESEIFITDWWICAKYYLKRPINMASEEDNESFRLDHLLL
jgi:hypothetical protein